MLSRVTTGAYIIRKRDTSIVIKACGNAVSAWDWVVGAEQDEANHRDQQIWWVEPLPDLEREDEMAYSITIPSNGNALGLKCINGKQSFHNSHTYLTISPENGAPWQRWRIRESGDSDGRKYYTISSVHNDQVVGETHETWLLNQVEISGYAQQQWEFVIPVVAFPSGWFQIQNTSAGKLLTHTYLSKPPVLVSPPSSTPPSENRENWGNQWTLIHAKTYSPPDSPAALANGPWCIRNRLTKGFLRGTTTGVAAWETKINDIEEHTWRLELDSDSNWNIINNKTSFLLENSSTSNSSGVRVICTTKGRNIYNSWVFTSAAIKNKEGVCIQYVGAIRDSEPADA